MQLFFIQNLICVVQRISLKLILTPEGESGISQQNVQM